MAAIRPAVTWSLFRTLSNIYDGKYFCKNSWWILPVNYYLRKAPWWMFERILDMFLTTALLSYFRIKVSGVLNFWRNLDSNNWDISSRGVMFITLHKFIQQGLNSGSAQFQILFAACRRFAMAKVLEKDPGWRKD